MQGPNKGLITHSVCPSLHDGQERWWWCVVITRARRWCIVVELLYSQYRLSCHLHDVKPLARISHTSSSSRASVRKLYQKLFNNIYITPPHLSCTLDFKIDFCTKLYEKPTVGGAKMGHAKHDCNHSKA